jgi:hypothetical protein
MQKLLRYSVALALALAATSAAAQVRHEDEWRDHDIHRFHEHGFERWRGGHWVHGRHEGRLGWWWVVGPTWYFYPAPVYPYPDPYVPPGYAPPPPTYYYCDNLPGYYPYVPACRGPWRPVPAG